MNLRIIVASIAVHAGLLAGAAAWLGHPSQHDRAHPARLVFAPSEASVPIEETRAPTPTIEVGAAPEPDPHWLPAPTERTFDPRDFRSAPPPEAAPPAPALQDVAPAEPLVRVRAPDVDAAPPVETPTPVSEPAVRPPAPESVFVEAHAIQSVNRGPEYPRAAVLRGWSGTVVLRIAIDADGGVTDVRVAIPSRYATLDRAALRAALGWRFEPARRDGIAVASVKDLPVEFRLLDR